MSHHDECDYCLNPANGIVRSPLSTRSEALTLYLRLQSRGFLPSMCENSAGQYRVCFAEKDQAGS